MCGIAGSLYWKDKDDPVHIESMVQALRHRGPDAQHVTSVGKAILGHARLSVIDTRNLADQPMQDASGRYWITYNGELYNYRTIKKKLQQMGHNFQTESDTEVLLEAWKAWGIDALQQCIGMFAFAIWDKEEEMFVLVRDRMGEKPLYYSFVNQQPEQGIIFASELGALRQHPAIKEDVDPEAISQFLSMNYILNDHCILQHIHKLPPAHILVVKKGTRPTPVPYWNLAEHFKHKRTWSEKTAIDHLNHLLDEIVSNQMISDVSLGGFLSGGLDSSTIIAAMTRNAPGSIHTFSTGFDEASYNELESSQVVADFLHTQHHTETMSSSHIEKITNIITTYDEPFADSSLIPTYYLAQFTRNHVTVALSGDGSDECFAGYETYSADKLYHLSRHLPRVLFKVLNHTTQCLLPSSFSKVSWDYKLKHFLAGACHNFPRAHYLWRNIFSDAEKTALLRNSVDYDPYDSYRRFYDDVSHCHYLDQASYVDMKTWLVDDILVKVDRAAMAHSLETRMPFLDHRLVEFAASLPPQLKMHGWNKKHLLKQSQQPYLSAQCINQKKQGFNAPISHWLNGSLAATAREITMDRTLQDWFNLSVIEKLWQHTRNSVRITA